MKKRFKILAIIAPAVFLLDQLTKEIVTRHISLGERIPVLPGFFDLVHIRNRGAAFGSFASLPDSIRHPFFMVTSSIALLLILFYFLRIPEERPHYFANLSLILGGALANITDRLFRGEVIDFLSLHWYDKWIDVQAFSWRWSVRLEWPAFNVADMAISVGAVWLMALMLKK